MTAHVDRWTQALADSRQRARDAGIAVEEPAVPILPAGVELPLIIHFVSGTQLLGMNLDYGDEMEITEQMLPDLTDRQGDVSVLTLLDDKAGQIARWGSWRIRRGPWPTGVSKIAPGSAAWVTARADTYRYARGLPFESERESALIEARKRFGNSEFGPCPSGITSRAYGFEPQQ